VGAVSLVPTGPDDPLWWTLRRPFRALNYHAARAMFVRANAALGSNWTLHDLRHSAAYRLARDPLMPITDIQWVLGHARLSTTQRYVTPTAEDVIEGVLAHHRHAVLTVITNLAPEIINRVVRSRAALREGVAGRPSGPAAMSAVDFPQTITEVLSETPVQPARPTSQRPPMPGARRAPNP
jgi:hypothetical protein